MRRHLGRLKYILMLGMFGVMLSASADYFTPNLTTTCDPGYVPAPPTSFPCTKANKAAGSSFWEQTAHAADSWRNVYHAQGRCLYDRILQACGVQADGVTPACRTDGLQTSGGESLRSVMQQVKDGWDGLQTQAANNFGYAADTFICTPTAIQTYLVGPARAIDADLHSKLKEIKVWTDAYKRIKNDVGPAFPDQFIHPENAVPGLTKNLFDAFKEYYDLCGAGDGYACANKAEVDGYHAQFSTRQAQLADAAKNLPLTDPEGAWQTLKSAAAADFDELATQVREAYEVIRPRITANSYVETCATTPPWNNWSSKPDPWLKKFDSFMICERVMVAQRVIDQVPGLCDLSTASSSVGISAGLLNQAKSVCDAAAAGTGSTDLLMPIPVDYSGTALPIIQAIVQQTPADGKYTAADASRMLTEYEGLKVVYDNLVKENVDYFTDNLQAFYKKQRNELLDAHQTRKAEIQKWVQQANSRCDSLSFGEFTSTLKARCQTYLEDDSQTGINHATHIKLSQVDDRVAEIAAMYDAIDTTVDPVTADVITQLDAADKVEHDLEYALRYKAGTTREWVEGLQATYAAYAELKPKLQGRDAASLPQQLAALKSNACSKLNGLYCAQQRWGSDAPANKAEEKFAILTQFMQGFRVDYTSDAPGLVAYQNTLSTAATYGDGKELAYVYPQTIEGLKGQIEGLINQIVEHKTAAEAKQGELVAVWGNLQAQHTELHTLLSELTSECDEAGTHCSAQFELNGYADAPIALFETLGTEADDLFAQLGRYFADDYVPVSDRDAAIEVIAQFEGLIDQFNAQMTLAHQYQPHVLAGLQASRLASSGEVLAAATEKLAPLKLSYPGLVGQLQAMQTELSQLCVAGDNSCATNYTAQFNQAKQKLGTTDLTGTEPKHCAEGTSVCQAIVVGEAALANILPAGCTAETDEAARRTCVEQQLGYYNQINTAVDAVAGFAASIDEAAAAFKARLVALHGELVETAHSDLAAFKATINGLIQQAKDRQLADIQRAQQALSSIDDRTICQHEASSSSCAARMMSLRQQVDSQSTAIQGVVSTLSDKLPALDAETGCGDPDEAMRASCHTQREAIVAAAQAEFDKLDSLLAAAKTAEQALLTQQQHYQQYLAMHPEVETSTAQHQAVTAQVSALSTASAGHADQLTAAEEAATTARASLLGAAHSGALHYVVRNMQVVNQAGDQVPITDWATEQVTYATDLKTTIETARDSHCLQSDEAAKTECQQSYQTYLDLADTEVDAVREASAKIGQLVSAAEATTDRSQLISIGYQLQAAQKSIQVSNETLTVYNDTYVSQLNATLAETHAIESATARRLAEDDGSLSAAELAETAVVAAKQASLQAKKPRNIPAIRRFDIHNCAASSEYSKDSWCGFVEPNLQFQGGNSNVVQFGSRAALAKRSGDWEYGVLGQADYNKAEGQALEESYWLGAKVRYFYSNANAMYNETSYENTALQGYKYLLGNTTGVEHRTQWGEDMDVLLGVGLGVRRSVTTDAVAETDFIQDLRGQLAWAISPTMSLNQLFTAQIGNFGDSLTTLGSTTTLNTRISDNLSMAYSFEANHKSIVPARSRKTTTGGKVGLRYDF